MIIIDSKFPQLYSGGISAFTIDLMDELKKQNISFTRVDFTTMSALWPLTNYLPRQFKILLYDLVFFPWYLSKLKDQKVKQVLLPYHDCVIPSYYWERTVFFCWDDSILLKGGNSLKDKLITLYYRVRLSRILKYEKTRCLTGSYASADSLSGILGFRPEVVYNKLHSSFFKLIRLDKFGSEMLTPLRVMYSGGFHFRKNFTFACFVVQEIAQRWPGSEISLVVTGEIGAQDLAEMSSIIKSEKIQLETTGAISVEEISQLYRISHINIYPTSQEGFGRVLIEAAISGCFVYVRDLDVFRELKLGSDFVRILNQDSAAEWADQMIADLEGLVKSQHQWEQYTNQEELDRFGKFSRIPVDNILSDTRD